LVSLKNQFPEIQTELDNRIYTLMGTLSRLGFRAERFDRISDFTRDIAIVPVSAKTGEGIPELLAILTGLTQAYLSDELQVTSGPARGTVLEVKDEPGLGTTINAIIFDGSLHVDDTVVLGGREHPIVTEVRAILVPKPLDEIRDPRDRFTSVKRISAASGVKIAAPGLEAALAGSPLYAVVKGKNAKEYVRIVEDEVEKLRIKADRSGIVLKTDTLGSLEAVTEALSRHDVQIRIADIGDVSRRDVVEAVRNAKFGIYAVGTIDEGIEILTGISAGERDESGNFPEGTVNQKVESRLLELAQKRIAAGQPAKTEEPT
jgi:translation initiation factor 5B